MIISTIFFFFYFPLLAAFVVNITVESGIIGGHYFINMTSMEAIYLFGIISTKCQNIRAVQKLSFVRFLSVVPLYWMNVYNGTVRFTLYTVHSTGERCSNVLISISVLKLHSEFFFPFCFYFLLSFFYHNSVYCDVHNCDNKYFNVIFQVNGGLYANSMLVPCIAKWH